MKLNYFDENINKIILNFYKKHKQIQEHLNEKEYLSIIEKFLIFLLENDLTFNHIKKIHKNSMEISLITNNNISNINDNSIKDKKKIAIINDHELIRYINSYPNFILDKRDLHFFQYFLSIYKYLKKDINIQNDIDDLTSFIFWMNKNINYEKLDKINSKYPISDFLNLIYLAIKPVTKGNHFGANQKELFYKDIKYLYQLSQTYLFEYSSSLEKIKLSFQNKKIPLYFKNKKQILFEDEKNIKKEFESFCKKYNENPIDLISAFLYIDSFESIETFNFSLFDKNEKYIILADIAHALNIDILKFWLISKKKFENFDKIYEYFILNCRKNNENIYTSFFEFEMLFNDFFESDIIVSKIINLIEKK